MPSPTFALRGGVLWRAYHFWEILGSLPLAGEAGAHSSKKTLPALFRRSIKSDHSASV